MHFFEVVQTRRPVRAFTATPIERDKLETILATARLAPSAGDLQAFQIVVIDEAEAKGHWLRRLWASTLLSRRSGAGLLR